MAVVFVGVGSNLGNRRENIQEAIKLLGGSCRTKIIAVSKLLETKPDKTCGLDFINGVLKIETDLEPQELLVSLQKVENALGRKRLFKGAPRTIDLDILLYDDRVVNDLNLTIPHPRMFERDFVMKPLLDLEPKLKNACNR